MKISGNNSDDASEIALEVDEEENPSEGYCMAEETCISGSPGKGKSANRPGTNMESVRGGTDKIHEYRKWVSDQPDRQGVEETAPKREDVAHTMRHHGSYMAILSDPIPAALGIREV